MHLVKVPQKMQKMAVVSQMQETATPQDEER